METEGRPRAALRRFRQSSSGGGHSALGRVAVARAPLAPTATTFGAVPHLSFGSSAPKLTRKPPRAVVRITPAVRPLAGGRAPAVPDNRSARLEITFPPAKAVLG